MTGCQPGRPRRPFSAAVRPSRRNIDVLLAFQYGCGAPWTGAHSLHKKFADRHRLTRRLFGVRKEEDFRGRAESLVKRQSARWTGPGAPNEFGLPALPMVAIYAPENKFHFAHSVPAFAIVSVLVRAVVRGCYPFGKSPPIRRCRPPLTSFHLAPRRLRFALIIGRLAR